MSSAKEKNNMSYIEKQDTIKIRRVVIVFPLIQGICCLLIEKYVNDHYSEPEYFGGFLTVGKYIVLTSIVLLNFLMDILEIR